MLTVKTRNITKTYANKLKLLFEIMLHLDVIRIRLDKKKNDKKKNNIKLFYHLEKVVQVYIHTFICSKNLKHF